MSVLQRLWTGEDILSAAGHLFDQLYTKESCFFACEHFWSTLSLLRQFTAELAKYSVHKRCNKRNRDLNTCLKKREMKRG